MSKSHQTSTSSGEASPAGRAPPIATVIVAVVWLSAIVAALILIIAHSNSPSNPGTPPAQWPDRSQIPLDNKHPTLVMFAHPRCPCTRASLGELELLLAQCPGQFSAHVMFIRPAGTAEDWTATSLCRKAAAIAGVNVHYDKGGVEVRRFHSMTSGHVLLYDQTGRLLFQGGITASRGHSGDNQGRSSITAFARHQVTYSFKKTPVFGCSLFEADCQEEGIECTK